MSGHVQRMRNGGDEQRILLGGGDTILCVSAVLDRMNQKVKRSDVIWILRENFIQQRDALFRSLARLARLVGVVFQIEQLPNCTRWGMSSCSKRLTKGSANGQPEIA